MLIEYELQGIRFEWDGYKADTNFLKHGIAFETACEVLLDPFVRGIDVEEIDGEDRSAIIGMTVAWKLLYVAYTLRNEDRFRIISARPVTRSERRRYEEY